MSQYGNSDRDLTQVGRDFIKKNVEINFFSNKKNKAQITEFEYYIDNWNDISSPQRVDITMRYIEKVYFVGNGLIRRTQRVALGAGEGLWQLIFWLGFSVATFILILSNIYEDTFINTPTVFLSLNKTRVGKIVDFCIESTRTLAEIILPHQSNQNSVNVFSSLLLFSFFIFFTGYFCSIIESFLNSIKNNNILLKTLRYKVETNIQMARTLFNLLSDEERATINENPETRFFMMVSRHGIGN
ncbi:MAG: hypothetical protein AAFY76_00820 [Cyanobacteria bacterium J06649_11]